MIINKVVVGRVVRAYRAAKGNDIAEYETAINGLLDPVVCGYCWNTSTIKRHVQKLPNGAGSALCIVGIIIDYQVGVPPEVCDDILADIDDWLFEQDLPANLSTEKVSVKSRRLHGALLSSQRLLRETRTNIANNLKEYY